MEEQQHRRITAIYFFLFFAFLNKVGLQLIVLFTVQVTEKSFTPYSPLNLFFSYSRSPPPLQAFNKPQEYKSEKKTNPTPNLSADQLLRKGFNTAGINSANFQPIYIMDNW